MNKILLCSISLLILFASCEEKERLIKSDVGKIRYEATIGYDFNSALDSLLKVIIYEPSEPHIVVAEPINAVYSANDREFYWIAFKDTTNRTYLQSPIDVLDTKGEWYKIIWGED